jgi:hypothetical protein
MTTVPAATVVAGTSIAESNGVKCVRIGPPVGVTRLVPGRFQSCCARGLNVGPMMT